MAHIRKPKKLGSDKGFIRVAAAAVDTDSGGSESRQTTLLLL